MPFFCAIPTNLPRDPNGVEAPPSAGPYYVADRTPGRTISIKKNPYYRGKRPHNVAEIVYTIGNSQEATRLRVERGDSDYAAGGVPAPAYGELAQKYGVNKSQLYVRPRLNVFYFALNTSRPIFKNNAKLRKAINFAIDRKAILTQNGYLAGKRTDQILPPGMAGFKDADLYPLKGPNLKAARKWANGATRDGKLVYYAFSMASAAAIAQIFAFDVKQIGLETEVEAVRPERRARQGLDPGRALRRRVGGVDGRLRGPVRLHGRAVERQEHRGPEQPERLVLRRPGVQQEDGRGSTHARNAALLDVRRARCRHLEERRPMAPYANFNTRIFVSKRVGCFTTSNVYQVNLAALRLK